jgi:hypothetical protein
VTSQARISVIEYDSQGNVVRRHDEADFNGDGVIDYTSVATVVYDGVKH